MAINARRKGAKNERIAAEFFKEWTGMDFRRTPGSGGLRGHVVDYTEGDLVCTQKNYIFPLCIEVKAYEELNFNHLLYDVGSKIKKFWKQTKESAKRAEKIPILLMRYNGLPRGFFFVVITSGFQHKLGEFFEPQLQYNGRLVITTTEALKKMSWENADRVAKQILKIK